MSRLAPLLILVVAIASLLAKAALPIDGQGQTEPESVSSVLPEGIRKSVVLIECRGRVRRRDADQRGLFSDPSALSIGALEEFGAGVIIDPSGLVLTHAALVPFEQPRIIVRSPEGVFAATVVARAPAHEAALLKIEAPDKRRFTSAATLDRRRPVNGQLVLCMGNPFGVGRDGRAALGLGVVSAVTRPRARELVSPSPLILTDAALNPGTTGGPMFDLSGRLLGIQAPLIYDLDDDRLCGGALPLAELMTALDAVRAPARPYLGLVLAPGNVLDGLAVRAVRPGSPADRGGVRAGDLLRMLDAEHLSSSAQLAELLEAHRPGDSVELTLRRGDRAMVVTVSLGRDR